MKKSQLYSDLELITEIQLNRPYLIPLFQPKFQEHIPQLNRTELRQLIKETKDLITQMDQALTK
jgi:hypothetical protein